MIGFYNYTVILTYVGLASSVLGIFMACEDKSIAAVICLAVAGVCDLFDGRIARTMSRTKEEKRFGIQIDSLCDLVGFGILPVVIGYTVTGYSQLSVVVYTTYVLAAVIRLAYYNVTEEIRQDSESGDREYFQGLPVTTITMIVPLLFLLRDSIKNFSTVYLAVIFFVALAFVTNIKVKKHPFADKREELIERLHSNR